MNSNYKVSVIVPNYNHSNYLNQRIDSILGQTFDDFELIILDDKSPDASCEVIEGYRNSDKVTHIVINEQNSGSTFNQWDRGLSLASGEYIWIAESDDFAEPTFLEKCVAALDKNPQAALCFTDSTFVDENGSPTECWIEQLIIDESDKDITDGYVKYLGVEFVRDYMLHHNYIFNASMVLFRKDGIAKISEYYRTFKGSGDYIFWADMILTKELIHIPERLNAFRQHSNKVSSEMSKNSDRFLEIVSTTTYLTNMYISYSKTSGYESNESLEITKIEKALEIEKSLRGYIQATYPIYQSYRIEQGLYKEYFRIVTMNRTHDRLRINLFGIIPLYKVKYRFQTEKHYLLGFIRLKNKSTKKVVA